MRLYTSLALGLLAAATGSACSSADDEAAPIPNSNVPFLPAAAQAPGTASANDATSPAPGSTAADNPAVGGIDSNPNGNTPTGTNEGGPIVTQVAPSQPATNTETGSGQMDMQDADDQQVADPDVPEETEPEVPTETEPPATQVFLLFGQSNMWGVPNPTAQDMDINPRVEVLTLQGCGRHGANEWVPAQPPLHGCVGQIGTGNNGPGLGPGDYFAKTLADAFPEDTILLVPNAVPGVSITTFLPGQQNYNSLLQRAQMAQQRGEIRGMIFHQGESDSGNGQWAGRVKTVVDQLRSDLGIDDVPFIAGDLLIGGCCTGHNNLIAQLPNNITNTFVANADGFAPLPNDGFGNLHFDLPSQREFGRRYGELMLQALGQ